MTSWSSIDYYGRWKALHYFAKKFYDPILLSIEEEAAGAKLYITNEYIEESSLSSEMDIKEK